MTLLAEFSSPSSITSIILTVVVLLLVGFYIYFTYLDLKFIKTESEREKQRYLDLERVLSLQRFLESEKDREFKEQLLLHYKNIDNNLSALCENLDEDIVFD